MKSKEIFLTDQLNLLMILVQLYSKMH